MDSRMRKLRQRAREVGLDVAGPFFHGPSGGSAYIAVENSTGDLVADNLTPAEIESLIEKHQGVPRLADVRRRRRLED
jgi:hypothetical protein